MPGPLFNKLDINLLLPLFVDGERTTVGQHIELLLHLALDVGVVRRTQYPGQRAGRDTVRNRLAGERDIEDQAVEVPGRVGVTPAFFNQKLHQGGAIGKHAPRMSGAVLTGHPPPGWVAGWLPTELSL
ncbi:hypothetical protein MAGR_51910 [Mycolicibacterium agri]|uniref:Uncharacterized protein n=1 Tax=Mycolicibacterium agri TaxID=36811 RepID=A0A7I9W860_MYCAG|nr:hypothetical protein MAGR_51910 [Mycolicibacterium agri]